MTHSASHVGELCPSRGILRMWEALQSSVLAQDFCRICRIILHRLGLRV